MANSIKTVRSSLLSSPRCSAARYTWQVVQQIANGGGQCGLGGRCDVVKLVVLTSGEAGEAVVLAHAVIPPGLAHWRRVS